MKKIRITILKTTINNEYAREYCSEEVTKCPIFKEGDVFVMFVGSYASPNPPSADFTNTDTVRRK